MQYELIKSHITLCREDGLEKIEIVTRNLTALHHHYIAFQFGPVERFSDRKRLMIPATGDNDQFEKLREIILQGAVKDPVKHYPHITLMHPRDSTFLDVLFEQIEKIKISATVEFEKISFVERKEKISGLF